MRHDSHRPNDDRSGLQAMVGRRVRTGLVIAAVLGTLSLAGCGTMAGVGAVIPGASVRHYDDRLYVSLGTDPKTGYYWSASVDGPGLELTRNVFEHTSADRDAVDAPSEDVFAFKGTGAGTQKVTFTSEFMGNPKDVAKTLTFEVTTDANDQIVSVAPVA